MKGEDFRTSFCNLVHFHLEHIFSLNGMHLKWYHPRDMLNIESNELVVCKMDAPLTIFLYV